MLEKGDLVELEDGLWGRVIGIDAVNGTVLVANRYGNNEPFEKCIVDVKLVAPLRARKA